MCCPCATSPATAPHPRPPRWRWSNAAAHIADAGYECCSSWQVARAPHTSSSRRLEARRGEPLRTLAGNDSGRSCTYINSIGALRRTHGEDCQALQIAVNSLSARLLVELLAEEPECPHSPSLEALAHCLASPALFLISLTKKLWTEERREREMARQRVYTSSPCGRRHAA